MNQIFKKKNTFIDSKMDTTTNLEILSSSNWFFSLKKKEKKMSSYESKCNTNQLVKKAIFFLFFTLLCGQLSKSELMQSTFIGVTMVSFARRVGCVKGEVPFLKFELKIVKIYFHLKSLFFDRFQ